MYWILIEEGLVLARTALSAARIVNTAAALGNALTPDTQKEISRANSQDEEEIYLHIMSASLFEELCRLNPSLPSDRDKWLDWTIEALDSPFYLSAPSEAGAKTTSFITALGRVLAEEAPVYRRYLVNCLASYNNNNAVPLDFIRKYLSSEDNKKWITDTLANPEGLVYLEPEVKAVITALVNNRDYDATKNYKGQLMANTIISALIASFPAGTRNSLATTETITINYAYVPLLNSKKIRARSLDVKRYQDFSITNEMVKSVERALGDQMEMYSNMSIETAAKNGSNDSADEDQLSTTLKLAASQTMVRYGQRQLNRIKAKGAAYARMKWGRSAGTMAQRILSAYALKKGFKK